MTKDELLIALAEPLGTLNSDLAAEAEAQAKSDSEVAEALRISRALSSLSDLAMFGAPQSSDTEFIARLRSRLARAETSATPFGSLRLAGAMAAVCVIAMILVMGGGLGGYVSRDLIRTGGFDFAASLETLEPYAVDSLQASSDDLASLAEYLDIPQLADSWDFGDVTEQPLTEALLALDNQTLVEVLNDLEQTQFF